MAKLNFFSKRRLALCRELPPPAIKRSRRLQPKESDNQPQTAMAEHQAKTFRKKPLLWKVWLEGLLCQRAMHDRLAPLDTGLKIFDKCTPNVQTRENLPDSGSVSIRNY